MNMSSAVKLFTSLVLAVTTAVFLKIMSNINAEMLDERQGPSK
jgi:hypothetical protein